MITIGFVGQVSHGKSSVVNATLGCLTSPVAMKRSTYQPIMYIGDHDLAETAPDLGQSYVEKAISSSRISAEDLARISTPVVKRAKGLTCRIIDFPGFDDGMSTSTVTNSNDTFMQIFEQNAAKLDLIVFVSSSDRLFVHAGEVRAFKQVCDIVEKNHAAGRNQEIIVVANKYDFPDDEHDEIVANAAKFAAKSPTLCRVLKISAWKLYLHLRRDFAEKYGKNSWQLREMKKMERVEGKKLTPDELTFVEITKATHYIITRRDYLLKYVHTYPNNDLPLGRIVGYLKDFVESPKEIQSYLGAVVARLGSESAALQFLAANYIAMNFGISSIACIYLIKPSVLKCFAYAHWNDVKSLAKYLAEPWEVSGAIKIPPGIARDLFAAGVEVTLSSGMISLKSITKIVTGSSDTVTSNTIISAISVKKWREYFALSALTYGEILAKIVAGTDGGLQETVTTVGVNYTKFKEKLAHAFFVDGRTGVASRVVCEMIE